MADVTVNSNLRNNSGDPVELQPSLVTGDGVEAPVTGSGRRIPLTDESGKLQAGQMPEYLLPGNLPEGITEESRQELKDEVVESMTPRVDLVLLFENALA